jgi:hypothetical protein
VLKGVTGIFLGSARTVLVAPFFVPQAGVTKGEEENISTRIEVVWYLRLTYRTERKEPCIISQSTDR